MSNAIKIALSILPTTIITSLTIYTIYNASCDELSKYGLYVTHPILLLIICTFIIAYISSRMRRATRSFVTNYLLLLFLIPLNNMIMIISYLVNRLSDICYPNIKVYYISLSILIACAIISSIQLYYIVILIRESLTS